MSMERTETGFKALIVGIYTDTTADWKEGNPRGLRAVGAIFGESARSLVLPPDLEEADVRYYCLLRILNLTKSTFERGDVIKLKSNAAELESDLGSKYRKHLQRVIEELEQGEITIMRRN